MSSFEEIVRHTIGKQRVRPLFGVDDRHLRAIYKSYRRSRGMDSSPWGFRSGMSRRYDSSRSDYTLPTFRYSHLFENRIVRYWLFSPVSIIINSPA